MNYGKFKNSIRNLGFEDDGVFDENPSHIAEACNRANTLLHNIVEPNTKSFTQHYDDNDGYNSLNLADLIGFVGKSNKTPTVGNSPVTDYYYVDDTLFFKASGDVTVYYIGALDKLNENSPDDTEIDCREDLIPFLELLTAYYMWLDDDERKAVMYYNQFLEMHNAYLSSSMHGNGSKYNENRVTARVVGGIDI